MKRIRSILLAVLALFALAAFASSSAFAELPAILPAPTAKEPLKFNSKLTSKTAVVETTKGIKFTCEEAENKGGFTTATTGLVPSLNRSSQQCV
jgi:hypothetical protein